MERIILRKLFGAVLLTDEVDASTSLSKIPLFRFLVVIVHSSFVCFWSVQPDLQRGTLARFGS